MTNKPETPDEMDPTNEVPAAGDQEHERLSVCRRPYAQRVLMSALFLIGVGLLLQAFWPWLLPIFIFEGPLVQQAGERELTLVWYLTRPVSGELTVELEGEPPRVIPVERDGARCRATITGLEAGETYPYVIRVNQRKLETAEFRTNKPAGRSFMFIAFGDSGKGTIEQYRLAARMVEYDPDFLLHTGDLIYSRGERHRYRERFFRPYALLLDRVCFWPSIGNHDLTEPIEQSAYFEVFELPENGPPGLSPEHEYWFDYSDARIAVIDTERSATDLRERVAPWLRSVLQDAPGIWKFVVFHRPPYTAGAHAPFVVAQEALVPALEESGVDLVLMGHDHMYQRTHPIRGGQRSESGPVYIITGAGGARLYTALPPEKRPDYIAAVNDAVHSFTLVRVSGTELTLEQIALDGSRLDAWTLNKPAGDAR